MFVPVDSAVHAAILERDIRYRAMRQAVPDLDKPATERAPLSAMQARVIANFLAAEELLATMRSSGMMRDRVDALR